MPSSNMEFVPCQLEYLTSLCDTYLDSDQAKNLVFTPHYHWQMRGCTNMQQHRFCLSHEQLTSNGPEKSVLTTPGNIQLTWILYFALHRHWSPLNGLLEKENVHSYTTNQVCADRRFCGWRRNGCANFWWNGRDWTDHETASDFAKGMMAPFDDEKAACKPATIHNQNRRWGRYFCLDVLVVGNDCRSGSPQTVHAAHYICL